MSVAGSALHPAEQDAEVLVSVEDLVKRFSVSARRLGGGRAEIRAVDGVSLDIRRGETLGLVGESGCGKSTLARCITRLYELTSGRVVFDGDDISTLPRRHLRPYRREMQMIFQDPYGSLNPRRRVGSIIGDPFAIHGIAAGPERKRRVQDLMEVVGLNPEHYNRFPAEFSGGQRQRIGVARALALRPKLIVCDEPVSALRTRLGLTYLFVAHDLSVVRHVSDRIAVMYLGKIVEVAETEELFARPRHPYTNALLSAVLVIEEDGDARRQGTLVQGDVPSTVDAPPGCRFHPRCPKARHRCGEEEPLLEVRLRDRPDHLAACHYPVEAGEGLGRTPSPDDHLS